MKGIICYISSSGHTAMASKYLAAKLGNMELCNISRDPLPDLSQFDLVGFATYTDYQNAPLGMKDFIEALPQQNGKPAFILSTCAVGTGWTHKFMGDWLRRKGFAPQLAHRLDMPECYPVLRALGLKCDSKPSTRTLQKFDKFIEELEILSRKIESDTPLIAKSIWPSLYDIVTGAILPRKMAKIMMGPKFVNNVRCTACGRCAEVCPYNAIKVDGLPIFDEQKCNGCFACYSKCPSHAIYTKRMVNRAFYDGPSAELKAKFDI